MLRSILSLLVLLFSGDLLLAQGIGTSPSNDFEGLVQDVFISGNCLQVNDVQGCGFIGTFSNGGGIGLGGNGGVGIMLASGPLANAAGPNDSQGTSGTGGCGAYSALPGNTTEGSYLQFTFTPVEDFVEFNFVFASEEYGGDYDCSVFNDVFGFFLTGPNPGGGNYNNTNIALYNGIPITINNFNDQGCGDPVIYTNNVGGSFMEYDGYVSASINAAVDSCEEYTITIAVADVGDGIFDSAVFLEGKSFSTGSASTVAATIAGEELTNAFEGCQEIVFTFCKDIEINPISEPAEIEVIVGGTATNGVDYTGLPPGNTFTLTIPAGFECMEMGVPVADDGILEGEETFTLEITNNTCPCGANPPPLELKILENNLAVLVNDTELCPGGQPQLLIASPSGGYLPEGKDYTIQWKQCNAGFTNCVNASNVVFPGAPGQTLYYQVQVEDACGNTVTENVLVTVGGAPEQPVIEDPGILCPPGSDGYVEEIFLISNVANGVWSGPGIVDDRNGIFNVDTAFAEAPQFPTGGQPYTYTIIYEVSDECGTEVTATVDIQMESEPQVQIIGPGNICMGDTIVLDAYINGDILANAPGSGYWSTPNANVFIGDNGEVTGFTGNPPYMVSYAYTTPNFCYTIVDEIQLNFVESPTATLDGKTYQICPGGVDCTDIPIKLTGQAPWSLTYSIDGTNQAALNITQSQTQVGTGDTVLYNLQACTAGTYIIEIVSDINCTGVGFNEAVVETAPPLTVTFPDSTICYTGTAVQVPITFTGTPPFFLSAKFDGLNNDVPLIQNITAAQLDANGVYLLNISAQSLNNNIPGTFVINTTPLPGLSDALGCTPTINNGNFVIGTFAITDADITPETCDAANGAVTNVTYSGVGTNSLEYYWVSAAGDTVATTDDLTDVNAGTYTLYLHNAGGCVDTATYDIPDQPSPVLSGGAATAATCNLNNGSITDIVISGGTGNITYEWLNGAGTTINGAASIDLNNVAGGTYTLVATDANGCDDSLSLTIDAFASPILNGGIVQNAYCGQSNGSISGISVALATGVTNAVYSWQDSNGNEIALTTDLSNVPAGTYTFIVIDENDCEVSLPVFTVDDLPGPTLSGGSTEPETCSENDGAVVGISITGGATPYTYTWTDANGTTVGTDSIDLYNVTEGSYTLTVVDNANCEDEIGPFTVSHTPDIVATGGTVNNAACGDANGGISGINVSGGTPPYTYEWSNSTSNINLSNVGEGTYTFTVTDAANCTATLNFDVADEPAPIINGGSLVPSTCNLPNGAVNGITIIGGTEPLIIQWLNNGTPVSGATAATLSNATGGDYTLVVTDANNCEVTQDFTIPAFGNPTLSGGTVQNAHCGQSDGSITGIQLTLANGVTDADYVWTDAANNTVGNTANLNNVAAGTYTVTVTDENDCEATLSFTIDDLPAPTLSGGTPFAETCAGNDGGVNGITVSGGATPYSYSWTNASGTIVGSNDIDLSGVPQGTYTLTITDDADCVVTSPPFEVEHAPQVDATGGTVDNSACGDANGGINGINVSGGTTPYSYSWTNAAGTEVSTTLNLTNVLAGNYTFTVTDASDCQATLSFTINNEAGPTLSGGEATPAVCAEANGAINNVQSNGGTGTLTFSWTNASGSVVGNSINLANVSPNDYTLTVTDENGCTDNITITVGTLPLPTLNGGTVNNATCGEANGSIINIVATGQGTIDYVWQNSSGGVVGSGSGTSISLQNVAPDTYTLIITDENQCEESQTFTLQNEPSPVLSGGVANNSSCGNADGSINGVSVSGGTPPITYSWEDAAGDVVAGNGNSLSNVPAGAYTLYATDNNGCRDTLFFNIIDIGAPTVNPPTTVIGTTCSGNNGSIAGVSVSGGTPPYFYQWTLNGTPVINGNQADIAALVAGTYTLTVTGANDCAASINVDVPDAPGPVLSGGIAQASSFCADNGSISGIILSGGTAPFSYQWERNGVLIAGENDIDLQDVGAGNYTLTVTDDNDCTFSIDFTVTAANPPSLSGGTVVNETCSDNNGSITGIVSNGVTPLTYEWVNTNTPNNVISTSINLNNVAAGEYELTMTDGNDCDTTLTFTITDSPAPQISGGGTTPSSCGQSDGAVTTVNVSGGQMPYTYSWINAQGAAIGGNQNNLPNVPAGSYTLTVTDANDCTDTETYTVSDASAPIISGGTPTSTTCSQNNGSITGVSASGGNGNLSFTWTDAGGATVSTNQQLNGVAAGNYTLTVEDATGCVATKSFTITDQAAPQLSGGTVTPPTCGENNGSVTGVSASGGTAPLTYVWREGTTIVGNSVNLINVGPGTYTLTVTDANDCSDNISFDVIDEASPQITVDGTTVSDCGTGTGIASISVSGGVSPYQYEWTNSLLQVVSTVQDPTGLLPGTYTVAVTDANNCTITEQALVPGNIPPPVISCGTADYESLTFNWTAVGGANGYLVTYEGLNDTLLLSAATLTYTIEDLSPNQTVTLYVATVGEAGCGSSAFADNDCTTAGCPPVAVAISGLADSYCVGDAAVNLTVTPTGAVLSGAGISGLTFDPTIAGAGNIDINLVYEVYYDQDTCVYETQATTVVYEQPIADFELDSSVVCLGDLVNFSFTGLANNGDDILWDFGDGAQPATANGIGPHEVFWNTPGNKNISLTVASSNCNDATSQVVAVSEVTISTIGSTEIDLGESIELVTNGTSALNGSLDFEWIVLGENGNLSCENCQNPTATPIDSVTYQVTVEDEYGCTATTTVTIDVFVKPFVAVPTGFSPNGDGINDFFKAISREVTALELMVFSRWGEKMYETKEINHQGWNGLLPNGEAAELDVYVWWCRYKDNNGKEELIKGNVTLVR